MDFLTFHEVSHYYFSEKNYTKAIEHVDFTMKDGEFISIIGPSGCGKSTILSIIAQLTKQTEGHIFINGKAIAMSDMTVGYMLQQDYLFPWRTILDNVLIGPKMNGTLSSATVEEARTLLHEVGLVNVEEKFPQELSGGMRQRAALVRTLINDPTIFLLDEPFSALDYVTKLTLENLVASMIKTYKKSAILVTHDISEAISMSDRILLMDGQPGTIKKIFTIPSALRETKPFYVRRHEAYQALFDEIWQEVRGKKEEQVDETDD